MSTSHLAKSLFVAAIALISLATGAQAAVGRIQGSFNVSATGSAQYAIPIWVPFSTNVHMPKLSLTYDSRGENGRLGPGWSLTGLSAITRCNLTTAQDSTPQAILLNRLDGYCLDGRRLRLVSGNYGAVGATYQTELENGDFAEVIETQDLGNGAIYGPATFLVLYKDGTRATYGGTASGGSLCQSKFNQSMVAGPD